MDFTFNLGVSNKNFNQKPKNFYSHSFNKTNLTVPKFADLIMDGHFFAHNYCSSSTYSVKQKTIDNFDYTNVASIDFDHAPINLDEAYCTCKIKPTIAFTTMSNSETDNRYRFVYVFNEPIESNDDYRDRIITMLNLSFDIQTLNVFTSTKTVDRTCFGVAQQFLGTTNDKQLIVNPGNIISIDLLNGLLHEDLNTYQDFYNKYVFNDLNVTCPKSRIYTKEERGKTIALNSTSGTPIDIEEALSIVNSEHFKPTLHNYGDANLTPVKDPVYHYVGDLNIYAQKSYFNGGKVKVTKRNNTLYYQALILKNIDPSMKPELMLANLIWLVRNYYEKPGDFSPVDLMFIIKGVINQVGDPTAGKRKFIPNPLYDRSNPLYQYYLTKKQKQKELGKARSKHQELYVLSCYDCSKSIKENAINMGRSEKTVSLNLMKAKKAGIDVSVKSESSFDTFNSIYQGTPDAERSVRKLASLTGISKSSVQRYIQRIEGG